MRVEDVHVGHRAKLDPNLKLPLFEPIPGVMELNFARAADGGEVILEVIVDLIDQRPESGEPRLLLSLDHLEPFTQVAAFCCQVNAKPVALLLPVTEILQDHVVGAHYLICSLLEGSDALVDPG